MIGVGLLSAVVTLGGAGIGFLAYKVGTLSGRVKQLDNGVNLIAAQTQAGFEQMSEHLHNNLTQMSEIIWDDRNGSNSEGGVS